MTDVNNKKNISGAQFTQSVDDFRVQSASAAVTFANEDVMPDSAVYVTVDDQLLVTVNAMFNGNVALITARIMQASGVVVPLHFELTSSGNRGSVSKAFPLIEGYLLSVGITSGNTANGLNPFYAAASLTRTPFGVLQSAFPLCAGYLSNILAIGWPAWSPRMDTDGQGFPTTNSGLGITVPGAGAEWIFTVPPFMRVQIKSVSAILTTSAAVANRNVSLVMDDGANIYAAIPSGFSQAASLVDRYTGMDGASAPTLFDGKVCIPIPSTLIMIAGHRLRSLTTGIDAADQWTAPFLMGNIWLDI